jgi:predicted transcriptional regulator
MGKVVKRSLSFPSDVFEALEAQAKAQHTTVSALMTEAARALVRRQQGLAAVAAWEAEHGAFSDEELADADRLLDEVWRG